ncbi:unnamed protein product, partial [Amoebophrya sp. A25]
KHLPDQSKIAAFEGETASNSEGVERSGPTSASAVFHGGVEQGAWASSILEANQGYSDAYLDNYHGESLLTTTPRRNKSWIFGQQGEWSTQRKNGSSFVEVASVEEGLGNAGRDAEHRRTTFKT